MSHSDAEDRYSLVDDPVSPAGKERVANEVGREEACRHPLRASPGGDAILVMMEKRDYEPIRLAVNLLQMILACNPRPDTADFFEDHTAEDFSTIGEEAVAAVCRVNYAPGWDPREITPWLPS